MGGIDDEHGVEFEAHGSWLDIAHTSELERGEHLAIGGAAFDAGGDLFQQLCARGVFYQADEWFNLGTELDEFGVCLGFGGGNRRELRKEAELAQTEQRTGGGGGTEKGAAGQSIHGNRRLAQHVFWEQL